MKITNSQKLKIYKEALRHQKEKQEYNCFLIVNAMVEIGIIEGDETYHLNSFDFPEFFNQKPKVDGHSINIWFDRNEEGHKKRIEVLLNCISKIELNLKLELEKDLKHYYVLFSSSKRKIYLTDYFKVKSGITKLFESWDYNLVYNRAFLEAEERKCNVSVISKIIEV